MSQPILERDIPKLRERFHNVILNGGYSEQAAQRILKEYFEEYMKNIPQFIAMLKEYEDRGARICSCKTY